MKRIIISESFDPYFNLATEHQIFIASEEDVHLFLWQNDASVVIGRNQNLYAECNLAYLKEHNIKAVRRFSGGGAVYQDKGNVNFTFITKEKSANQAIFIEIIQSAMKRLDIDCEFSGRNDLLYRNQKFSGHAYYTDGDNYMYHGTILVNVDFDQLEIALTPSILKLKSKGIESVKSRVVNLSEVNSKVTVPGVINAFIESFEGEHIEYINKSGPALNLEKMLSSNEWLYGQSPKFDIEVEHKFPLGNISVYISVMDGLMNEVKINTDSLQPLNFKTCEEELKGKHLNEEMIWEYILKNIDTGSSYYKEV
jgi:lipoate-protein ligase A